MATSMHSTSTHNDRVLEQIRAAAPAIEEVHRLVRSVLNGHGPVVEISSAEAEQPATPGELAGAASLMRSAARLFGDGSPAEVDMDDVAELVDTASERLLAWTRKIVDEDGGPAFDALDACTAVKALIEGGNPCNSVTISPIRGILWMAVERLEGADETQVEGDGEAQTAPPSPSVLPAVETQRMKLLGVLGALQAMKAAVRTGEPPDELEAAVELLEDETQRIITALEDSSLRRASQAQTN
jgi:hypothetical protein